MLPEPNSDVCLEKTTIAGRYRVEAPLGKGGMAVVYQVEDLQTGRKLALKQLLPQISDNKTDLPPANFGKNLATGGNHWETMISRAEYGSQHIM